VREAQGAKEEKNSDSRKPAGGINTEKKKKFSEGEKEQTKHWKSRGRDCANGHAPVVQKRATIPKT